VVNREIVIRKSRYICDNSNIVLYREGEGGKWGRVGESKEALGDSGDPLEAIPLAKEGQYQAHNFSWQFFHFLRRTIEIDLWEGSTGEDNFHG